MRSIKFALLLALSILSTICYSQVNFGLSSGVNISNLYSNYPLDSNHSIYQPALRFRIGITTEIQFNQKLGLRAELNYSEGGAKIRSTESSIKVQYLSIPISFYYSPLKNLKIYTGPELNIKLGNNKEMILSELNDFNTIDYGAQIGLEWLATEHFGIGVKNYFGFQYNSSIIGYKPVSNGDPIIGDIKINRNNIFGLYAFYLIKQ
jgi:hypothetical protein